MVNTMYSSAYSDLLQIFNKPSRNIPDDITPEDDETCVGLLRRNVVAVFNKKSQRQPLTQRVLPSLAMPP